MTSLRESVSKNRWWSLQDWDEWADAYIRELEEHMKGQNPSPDNPDYFAWSQSFEEVLSFLRGEIE